jgi:hypothetical protein
MTNSLVSVSVSDDDERVLICLDWTNLEACKQAIQELALAVSDIHGVAAARQLLAEITPSRRAVRDDNNATLLRHYESNKHFRGWGAKQTAAHWAKKTHKHNPDAIEKQIRRLVKKAKRGRA